MRLDRATIPLEPRSVGHCLDLATSFFAAHAPLLAALHLLAALPVVLLIQFWCHDRPFAWLIAAGACLLVTGPLGILLTRGVAEATFGDTLTWAGLLRTPGTLTRVMFKVLGARLLIAVGAMVCLLPGLFAASWWGFLTESHVLSKLHRKGHDRRTGELVKAEYSDLTLRLAILITFGAFLWLLMLLTLDATVTVVWGSSPLLGRLSQLGQDIGIGFDAEVFFTDLGTLMFQDRTALILQTVAFFFVYPVIRIAWYFCYIDLRVRRDCWDMELALLHATRQLEAGA